MLKENHLNELTKSFINEDIIALNFKTLQANSWEYLLYAVDNSHRRNDGRLKDHILKRYQHLDHGGWWCSGIDLKTMQPSEWGCFKPDIPKIVNGKPIKYEHPPYTPTGIFALDIPKTLFGQISNKTLEDLEGLNFWQWVIENPVAITITEGAKKAACLLSQGHVTIALPGIWNGVKDNTLIPELQILSHVPRKWNIAFDEDAKWVTQNDVIRATKKLGEALINWQGSSEVFVLKWEPEEGKGVDDLVRLQGQGRLAEIYEERLELEDYLEKFGNCKSFYRDDAGLLRFIAKNVAKRLEFNELTGFIELDGQPLEIDESLAFKFIKEFNISASNRSLLGAIKEVVKERTYHPVQRYLEGCAELESISIDNLSTRYFGTTDPLYDYFVKQWLIGAVARVFEPGCQMDFALLLQSRSKGIGKTTFFRVLGGEWYNGSLPPKMESNKDFLTLHSAWIHEWGEFDRVSRKADANYLKDFVVLQKDKFVEPYGRISKDHARRSVLCGTVNDDEFLRDPDGDRRFLVLPISPHIRLIDNNLLREERDRIWGEAVRLYQEGKKQGKNAWAIPREVEQRIIELSKTYSLSDEWESLISDYLEGKDRISITEVLEKCLNIEPGKQDRGLQMRAATALSKLQWQKIGRGLDNDGRKRNLWGPTPVDIPQDQPLQKVCPSPEALQNNGFSNSQEYQPQGMSEVCPEVCPDGNGHYDKVVETEDIPTIQNGETNFSFRSLEQPEIVLEDSKEDREWQVGDRIQHQVSKKIGTIKSLNKDKSLARVDFEDGSLGQSLYTRMFNRVVNVEVNGYANGS